MRSKRMLLLAVGAVLTYGLFGPIPLMQHWRTAIGTLDGPDVNVPYEWKFGLFQIAVIQNWFGPRAGLRFAFQSTSALFWSTAICASYWTLVFIHLDSESTRQYLRQDGLTESPPSDP